MLCGVSCNIYFLALLLRVAIHICELVSRAISVASLGFPVINNYVNNRVQTVPVCTYTMWSFPAPKPKIASPDKLVALHVRGCLLAAAGWLLEGSVGARKGYPLAL